MATTVLQGSFTDEMKSRYLTYAMSTIMARALPDARDGLKPVHRRLLYVMRTLKLDPEKGYKKCARVVGDVIGKYHPHGDQAVYDAMVRLSQDFAVRYPMVDGQGNFGNIDGDNAAAMRYTEAKLTKVAAWMMKDLESGTVDFRANYDETESEPIVFTAAFPNLLCNGATGIAVGMSTSIPPHNVGEVCSAIKKLLKNPEVSEAALMKSVKGPDLPTGGIIAETEEAIQQCYTTGRGSIRVRARWEVEELPRGQYQIVVTEIPYQVQKSRLIEKIADLINAKKLPWLADIRDESTEDVRVVLEPKSRTVDAEALMEALFKASELETRLSVIMHAINGKGEPELLTLKRICEEFVDHRRNVLLRKTNWRLGKIADRLHILAAYKVVHLNIDEVIEIIKKNDKPAPIMMERFDIDEVQAEAILNMRLRRLRKLDEMEIVKEFDELSAEQKELQALLASEDKQTESLITEVDEIKKEFGDKRRTDIEGAPSAVVIPLEAQIEREPVTVLLSKHGWIKTIKGHMDDDAEAKFKEGDEEAFRLMTQSTSDICVLASGGKVYTVNANKLPSGRGFGEPLRLMVDLGDEDVVSMFEPGKESKYLVATKGGQGFIAEGENLTSQTKNGKSVLNVGKGDAAAYCREIKAGEDMVAVYSTENNRMLVFTLEEVPTLARGKGVKLMNVKDGTLDDVCVFSSAAGLGLASGRERVFKDLEIWIGKRAQVGKLPPHGYQTNLKFFAPETDAPKGDGEEDTSTEASTEEKVESKSEEKASEKKAEAPKAEEKTEAKKEEKPKAESDSDKEDDKKRLGELVSAVSKFDDEDEDNGDDDDEPNLFKFMDDE